MARKQHLSEGGKKMDRARRELCLRSFHAACTALLAVSAIALGVPQSAAAQTTAVYGGNPDHIDLSVPVTASIAVSCSFVAAPAGTFNAGELAAGFSHDFSFTVACNAPFRVAVVSQNGGLSAPVSPRPGYAALRPYDVGLALVGDAGVTPASATCTATSLISTAPSPCAFRGPASATSGLRLAGKSSGVAGSYLRVSASPYSGATLIASPDYHDALIVSVSAAS